MIFFFFQETKDEVIMFRFVTYMVYFPLTVVMLVLNCFGDATPEYVDFDRGEVRNGVLGWVSIFSMKDS